ncbi:MAG: cytochrome C [Candidatus Sedimenticola endophacoides]|nr:MAG: cytochrome C [Candidatus Sedimenticola endophacoides]PUE04386.1 MAG: cytochrome C [Candidatus Sedimenticola endophacoides]PUE04497.1 MAG: cytochrome C [Candidatus Sedimenticola endophacoides]
MKVKAIAVMALLSLGVAGNAVADGAALFTAKACMSCHGADGKSPIMPMYPKVTGQSSDYTYNQMMDIKSGARANGQSMAMKGIMAGVSEADARAIADWLATQ